MKLSLFRCLALGLCLAAPLGCANGPKSLSVASLPKPPMPRFMSLDSTPAPPRQAGFVDEMAKARNHEISEKLDKAREVYEQLIVDYPKRYEPYHRLAVVADRQKRYREAQALYTEALRLKPGDPQLLNDLGYCFFLQGQLNKAERAILKAVSVDPSNPRYRNNLGLVYGNRGEYERALNEFRRAGSEADAQYSLAFIFASRDDIASAKDRFRLALASDPTHENAQNALRDFERYDKDPQGVSHNSGIVKNGVRFVPYIEPTGINSGAQNAMASAAGEATHTATGLYEHARLTLAERLAAHSKVAAAAGSSSRK